MDHTQEITVDSTDDSSSEVEIVDSIDSEGGTSETTHKKLVLALENTEPYLPKDVLSSIFSNLHLQEDFIFASRVSKSFYEASNSLDLAQFQPPKTKQYQQSKLTRRTTCSLVCLWLFVLSNAILLAGTTLITFSVFLVGADMALIYIGLLPFLIGSVSCFCTTIYPLFCKSPGQTDKTTTLVMGKKLKPVIIVKTEFNPTQANIVGSKTEEIYFLDHYFYEDTYYDSVYNYTTLVVVTIGKTKFYLDKYDATQTNLSKVLNFHFMEHRII